jgi:predicted nucleotidyltransferase
LPQDQIMRPTAILYQDPKLARVADALRQTFDSRLVSALLFGSRARGDHRADSDYDVAVFLDGYDRARDL